MPLLALFLFGIIQYGYGLFQYQAFSSAMNDASRLVATGVSGCTKLTDSVAGLVGDNGLPIDADHPLQVSVQWLDVNGREATAPLRLGFADVTGTYQQPLSFDLVPFPDHFTITKRVLIQDIVPGVTEDLLTCPRKVSAVP